MNFTKSLIFSLFFISFCNAQDIVQLKSVNDTILNTKKTLRVSDPFDAVKTLQKLFPGKLYKMDKNVFVSWKCKNCKPATYKDVNEVDGDQSFPYTSGVATRVIKTIDYTDSKGNQFKILAFNHSVYDEDGLQTSRFSGGLLGLAKFAKNDKVWEMKSFQPAVAAFGSFAQCPTPKILEIGEDQYAFTLLHVNGGAGGPFDGTLYLVAGFDGKYQSIMEAYEYELTNSEKTNWSSTYAVVTDNNKKYFRDIIVTTKGSYQKAGADDEFEANPPTEAAEMAKTKKQFNFVIEKKYVFNGKHYKVSGKPVVKFSNVK